MARLRNGRPLELVHVVGAALIHGKSSNRCLAARRGPNVPSAGVWELPGGKVEAGEDPRAALTRELREEMAIAVRVGRFLGRSELEEGDRLLVLDIYVAHWIAGEMRLSDHDAACWLRGDQLDRVDWAPADVAILGAVRTLLSPEH